MLSSPAATATPTASWLDAPGVCRPYKESGGTLCWTRPRKKGRGRKDNTDRGQAGAAGVLPAGKMRRREPWLQDGGPAIS